MILFRIIFYIFIGYLIFQIIRLVMIASKVVKSGSADLRSRNTREKDISREVKIIDERRPEKNKGKSKK